MSDVDAIVNKLTLQHHVSMALHLVQQVIASDGELTPELEEALAINEQGIAAKVDGYQIIMEQAEAQEMLWKKKADQLSAVAKCFRSVRERLKNNLKLAMTDLKTDELRGDDYRLKMSRTKDILNVDAALCPPEYKMTITETVPDKERIRTALEEGETIPGCCLEPSFSLRHYVNHKGSTK